MDDKDPKLLGKPFPSAEFKPLGYPFKARLAEPFPGIDAFVRDGLLIRCRVDGFMCGTARAFMADDGAVVVSGHAGPFMDGTPPKLVLTQHGVDLVYDGPGATIEWSDEAPKPDASNRSWLGWFPKG